MYWTCDKSLPCVPSGNSAGPSCPAPLPSSFIGSMSCCAGRTVPNAAGTRGVLISPAVQQLDSYCLSVWPCTYSSTSHHSTALCSQALFGLCQWNPAGEPLCRLIKEARGEKIIRTGRSGRTAITFLLSLLIKKAASRLRITQTTDNQAVGKQQKEPSVAALLSLWLWLCRFSAKMSDLTVLLLLPVLCNIIRNCGAASSVSCK